MALPSIGVPLVIPHSIITTCVIFRFQSYGISQSHTIMQSIHSWFKQCLPHCTTSYCFGQPFCLLSLYMYYCIYMYIIKHIWTPSSLLSMLLSFQIKFSHPTCASLVSQITYTSAPPLKFVQ